MSSPTQGSAGNVLAAICSLVFPGIGQLVQGRFGKALWHVLIWGLFWIPTLLTAFLIPFWVLMHIWSALEAARWTPPGARAS
jgi:TM2 domain-containing membrane protein YozV